MTIDYIEKCKGTFYSRFLYLVHPKKIIKMKKLREELTLRIKYFVNKYIGEVDTNYQKDRILKEDEIDEAEILIKKGRSPKKTKIINEEIDRFYSKLNINS